MLVLSRKERESVMLEMADGTSIRVVLLENNSNQVKLGFDAPRSVNIRRDNIKDSFSGRKASRDGKRCSA